ncbi:MAG: hypothetical protein SNG02_07590 [Rikenellaceae bacterium]
MYKTFRKLAISAAVMIVTVCGVVASEVDDNLLTQTTPPINRRQTRGLVEMGQVFVPKGQWIVGSTASYSTHLNSSYSFLIIENISSDGYMVGVSPIVSYAVKNNLTVGARFEYNRSLLRVDTADISIGDDETGIVVAVNDIYSITQSYHGMATMRQYIPLGENKRFTLFTEFRLGLGGSVSKYAFDSPVQGTYAKSVDASVSVVPGIVAFATNNVAFEVTVGALGVSFSHVDQIQNQIYEGSMNSSNMSFMINLFSIGLGVAFYL